MEKPKTNRKAALTQAIFEGQFEVEMVKLRATTLALHEMNLRERVCMSEPVNGLFFGLMPFWGIPVVLLYVGAPLWWIFFLGVWVTTPPAAIPLGWILGISTWVFGYIGIQKLKAFLAERREVWVSKKMKEFTSTKDTKSIECKRCRNLDPKNSTSSGFRCTVCGSTQAA